jgi:hypothetical protein
MKTNERKIAFICFHLFFLIWPFQRVTADSIKKIPPPSPVVRERSEVNFGNVGFLLVGSLSTAGFNPATANSIAQISIFAKDVRRFSVDLHSARKKARGEGICATKKRARPRRQTRGQSI